MTNDNAKIGGLSEPANRIIAALGIAVLSPVLLVCAIIVKLSSHGPILFRQKRIGKNGRSFTMVKFRTMYHESKGPSVTASNDHRVTKFGSFLRRFKLDELPELFNVLRGDMAFVGPRPEVPEMVDMSDERWVATLRVLPGITGPVTLFLRNEEAYLAEVKDKETYYVEVLQPFKLKGYLKYMEKRTWKSDLKVMVNTVLALFQSHDKHLHPLEDQNYRFLEQSL